MIPKAPRYKRTPFDSRHRCYLRWIIEELIPFKKYLEEYYHNAKDPREIMRELYRVLKMHSESILGVKSVYALENWLDTKEYSSRTKNDYRRAWKHWKEYKHQDYHGKLESRLREPPPDFYAKEFVMREPE